MEKNIGYNLSKIGSVVCFRWGINSKILGTKMKFMEKLKICENQVTCFN